jgi:transcriptional regulator with XRE-family HTH domain
VRSVVNTARVCLGCGAILSRYNPGRRCAACVRSGRTRQIEPGSGVVHLGQQLAERRKRAGITQYDLATRAGVSVVFVRSLEGGERETARLRSLAKVADALGLCGAALYSLADSAGERMRSARHQHGLTLQVLARDCGMSDQDLSELEKGVRVLVHVPTANALAGKVGLSVVDLAPWLLADTLANRA